YRRFRREFLSPSVVNFVRGMPNLEELRLFANGFDMNELFALRTLTELRVLLIYHGHFVHRLHLLARNPAFRNLTHLLLHPHHHSWIYVETQRDLDDGFLAEEGYLPLSVVCPVLESANLPNLTHLRLRLSNVGDQGCREIVASGILKRLKVLDLRHGCVTDEGARTLAECPDVKNLEWLDLDRNGLTRE